MSAQLVALFEALLGQSFSPREKGPEHNYPVTEIRHGNLLVVLSDDPDTDRLASKLNLASERVVMRHLTPAETLRIERQGGIPIRDIDNQSNFVTLCDVFADAVQGDRDAQRFYEWARELDLRDTVELAGLAVHDVARRGFQKINFKKLCEDIGVKEGNIHVPSIDYVDALSHCGVISLASYGMAQAVFELVEREDKITGRRIGGGSRFLIDLGRFSPYDRAPLGQAALESAREIWDVMLRARIFEDYFESNKIELSSNVKSGLFKSFLAEPTPWDFINLPQIKSIEALLSQLEVRGLRLEPAKIGKIVGKTIFSSDPERVMLGELEKLAPSPKPQTEQVNAALHRAGIVSVATGQGLFKASIGEALLNKFPDSEAAPRDSARALLWECYKRYGLNVSVVQDLISKSETITGLIGEVERWKAARIANESQETPISLAKATSSETRSNNPATRWNLEYLTVDGSCLFRDWFEDQDVRVQTVLENRLRQMAQGNFGRNAPVGDSRNVFVSFSHQHGSPRIYFHRKGNQITVLLGGKEASQDTDRVQACAYARQLENRR